MTEATLDALREELIRVDERRRRSKGVGATADDERWLQITADVARHYGVDVINVDAFICYADPTDLDWRPGK